MKTSKRNYLVLATAAAAALVASSANAATYQWANTTGQTDWGTGSNWTPVIGGTANTVPGSGDTAQLYNTGTGGTTVTYVAPVLSGSFSLQGLQYRIGNNVGLGPAALSISRGSGTSQLTIGSGGITSADSNTVFGMTINPDIVVGATQTWNPNNAALTLNGAISGGSTVTITKQGSGNLTLNGSITNYLGNISNASGGLIFTTSSIYGGVISGGGFFVNGGVLTLAGANTYTGVTNLVSGTARVSSLAISGSSGQLGTNATIKFGGTTSTTGSLDYTGAGESTSRTFDLAGGNGNGTNGPTGNGFGTVNNLGFGTLTLAGNVTNSGALAGTTNTLNLLGNIDVTGSVSNSTTTTGKTAISAVGSSGTVTLKSSNTGSNGFTGGIGAQRGGTMVVDYTNGAAVLSNSVNFASGGTLNLLASAGSPATQGLGNVAFTDGINRILVTNTNLTVGTLSRTSNNGAAILFDLSNGGTLTADTTGTAGSLKDNVIVGGTASSSFAGFIVRTSSGYDFASALTSGTAQNIIALGANTNSGATTTFTGSQGTGNTINGRLVASSTTVSTAQTLGTLRIDTTAAAVGTGGAGGSMTITGSNSLSLSSSSKNGLMFDGSGNYTINGTGSLSAIGIYQYSSGTVTVNSAWGTSTRIDKFGPGLFVNNTATAFASSGSLGLDLWEGVYRAGTANAVSGGGRLNFGGGILELTSGSSDFTRTLGTGTTNVNFIGDGGFSAFGGTRAVSIGGTVTPSNLVWSNTGSFLGNGNKLLLSSSTSDSTIDFQNSIDFNGVQREVSVGNGGASIDALLSGKLTTDNYAGGGLYKSGAGTLAITGSANTYAGGTSIVAGKVIAGTGTANTNGNLGSGNVAVWSAGTVLELDNANSIADTSSLILGNGTNLTLNFTGVGYEKVASVTIDGVLFNGPTIFTSSNLNGVNASYFTFADSTSGLQVVPEPTGLAFLGLGAGALLARRRRYRGN